MGSAPTPGPRRGYQRADVPRGGNGSAAILGVLELPIAQEQTEVPGAVPGQLLLLVGQVEHRIGKTALPIIGEGAVDSADNGAVLYINAGSLQQLQSLGLGAMAYILSASSMTGTQGLPEKNVQEESRSLHFVEPSQPSMVI